MTFILATLVPILTAIGLGGMLGAYFQARFQHRTKINQQEHELKQKRYLCTMILMLTKLNAEIGMPKLREARPDLKNSDDLDKELEVELLHGFIYADDEVLKSLAAFIHEPNHRTFSRVAGAMRRDLWGNRSEINEGVLDAIKMFRSVERQIESDYL